jgi:hypothetical protein
MTTFWVAIAIGLVIVLLAIGIPLYMTHRRMYPHYDRSDADQYLDSTGRSPGEVAAGKPARMSGSRLRVKRSHVTTSGARGDRPAS